MAINYYKTVLGVAVQIMTMVLLVGIGSDLLSTFYGRMNKSMLNFEELGVMLVFCMALLMLVNRVPPLVAGIITGSSIGSVAGIGSFGAGAVVGATVGAASMAAGAASMAGSAVMGGAANIGGGASAIMAAYEKAQATMANGGDMPSLGGSTGEGRSGGSDTPFAQAAGFASDSSGGSIMQTARMAAGTAGNLAKEIGSRSTDNFKSRTAQTAGGRIATSIRESSPSFQGNSITGDKGPDGLNQGE